MANRIHVFILLVLLAACRQDPQPRTGGAARGEDETAAAAAPVAAPAATPPSLGAIDLFGTEQITREQLLASHGDRLRAYATATTRAGMDIEIAEELARLGDFAHVELSLVGYYQRDGMKYYLTVDFVDRDDAARRMPFLREPIDAFEDPEGLLADWHSFESAVHELMRAGQLSPARVECPAYHCLGDPSHPRLAQLAEKFEHRVGANVEALAEILSRDADADHRAAAAYLLAYMADGPALVELMLPAFRDSSALVRNNAMRVIADISFHHAEVQVPIEPVLEALEYPATTDRNKAAAILDGLLAREGAERHYAKVVETSGATLLAMLRLEQPNNHDFAYSILETVSGKSFGERDYPAWEAWLAEQAR